MIEINPWDYWYSRKEGIIEPEVPKLVDLLKSNRFSRILDLGCGMGRHVLHFARAGFEVYSIDISTNAIAKIQQLLKRSTCKLVCKFGICENHCHFRMIISTR